MQTSHESKKTLTLLHHTSTSWNKATSSASWLMKSFPSASSDQSTSASSRASWIDMEGMRDLTIIKYLLTYSSFVIPYERLLAYSAITWGSNEFHLVIHYFCIARFTKTHPWNGVPYCWVVSKQSTLSFVLHGMHIYISLLCEKDQFKKLNMMWIWKKTEYDWTLVDNPMAPAYVCFWPLSRKGLKTRAVETLVI